MSCQIVVTENMSHQPIAKINVSKEKEMPFKVEPAKSFNFCDLSFHDPPSFAAHFTDYLWVAFPVDFDAVLLAVEVCVAPLLYEHILPDHKS